MFINKKNRVLTVENSWNWIFMALLDFPNHYLISNLLRDKHNGFTNPFRYAKPFAELLVKSSYLVMIH